MVKGPRMTLPTQLVLQALLVNPSQGMYGLEISQTVELPSGTIHPILARLEGYGWLESRWEDIDPREKQRPRRRYYRLTPDGAELSQTALRRKREQSRQAGQLHRLRPGLT